MHTRETVLLTGASGFLGSNLVRLLLASGYVVLAYRRKSSNLSRLQDIVDQVSWFDIECLEEPFINHKIDHLIHVATCYGRNNEKTSEIVAANILFPIKLFELAQNHNIKTFINTDTALDKALNAYALSKKQFTEWLQQTAAKVKIINVKLEHFYGPGDDTSKFITYVIDRCARNVAELSLTLGEQKRDFIYIGDVVLAYMTLLHQHESLTKQYNDIEVGSGQVIKIRDVVQLIAKTLNSETKLLFGALPYREHEVMELCADLTKIKQLGWFPQTSIEDGINKSIAAYMKGQKL